MVTINGFGLKNLRKYSEHDGYPVYKADINYKGKVVGLYKEDDHGG